MFQELIHGLTRDQMQALKELGVPHPRVSEWKHGKGLPSRRAVAALAQVTGVDAMELERAVMILEIKPEERALFQRALRIPASAMTAVFLVLGLSQTPENALANQQVSASKGGETVYTSWKVNLAVLFAVTVTRIARRIKFSRTPPIAWA